MLCTECTVHAKPLVFCNRKTELYVDTECRIYAKIICCCMAKLVRHPNSERSVDAESTVRSKPSVVYNEKAMGTQTHETSTKDILVKPSRNLQHMMYPWFSYIK